MTLYYHTNVTVTDGDDDDWQILAPAGRQEQQKEWECAVMGNVNTGEGSSTRARYCRKKIIGRKITEKKEQTLVNSREKITKHE